MTENAENAQIKLLADFLMKTLDAPLRALFREVTVQQIEEAIESRLGDITEMVQKDLDVDAISDTVLENIDYDDIVDKVNRELDIGQLADDVADELDYDALAEAVIESNSFDVKEAVQSVLDDARIQVSVQK